MLRMRFTCLAALAFIAATATFSTLRFVPSGQAVDCGMFPDPAGFCYQLCNSLTLPSIPLQCVEEDFTWTITDWSCDTSIAKCACWCGITSGGTVTS